MYSLLWVINLILLEKKKHKKQQNKTTKHTTERNTDNKITHWQDIGIVKAQIYSLGKYLLNPFQIKWFGLL